MAPECFGAEASIDAQLAAINGVIGAFDGHVRALPGKVYSYVPRSKDDSCDGAAIIHYRGPRKEWMAAEGLKDGAWRQGRDHTHPGLRT